VSTEQSTEQPLERPRLTLSEAARAAGVSKSTLRRRLTEGAFPGARRDPDPDGPWRVPIQDLLAAGLSLNRAEPNHEPPVEPSPEQELRERVRVAEAVAHERQERIAALERSLDDLRTALRALGAGEPVRPAPQPPPEPVREAGFWRRVFGG
jgi:hypothetical protein